MVQALYKEWLTEESLEKIRGWARDGLTDEQIAHNIGIARQTLALWKKKYPDIDDALKKGKEVVDFEVENALLKRALGTTTTTTQYKMIKVDKDILNARRKKYVNEYMRDNPDAKFSDAMFSAVLSVPTYEKIPIAETVTEVPPDTSAGIFWLKSRRPDIYRDQTFRKLNKANAKKAEIESEISKIKLEVLKQSGSSGVELLNEYLDKLDALADKEVKEDGTKADV